MSQVFKAYDNGIFTPNIIKLIHYNKYKGNQMKHELQHLKDKYRQAKWWLHYYQSEILGGLVILASIVLMAIVLTCSIINCGG